jgi:DNA-binding LacI/PurR family transcriptional regulator
VVSANHDGRTTLRRFVDKVRLLLDRGAEALLLVSGVEDPDLTNYIEDLSIPVVTTYSYLTDKIVPSIGLTIMRSSRSGTAPGGSLDPSESRD